jgi:hypothetical protein
MFAFVVVDVALIFWLLLLLAPHIIVLEIYVWICVRTSFQGKKCWCYIATARQASLRPEFSKNFASMLLSSLRLFLQKLQKKKRCRLSLGRTPVGRQLRPEEKEEQGEKEEK